MAKQRVRNGTILCKNDTRVQELIKHWATNGTDVCHKWYSCSVNGNAGPRMVKINASTGHHVLKSTHHAVVGAVEIVGHRGILSSHCVNLGAQIHKTMSQNGK